MYEICLASQEHLDEICNLAKACTADLAAKGIFQWDERWPSREMFQENINQSSVWVLTEQGSIKGVVVLNESQSPEWEAITWQSNDGKQLVIHSLAIHPDYQGKGYGRALLRFCEEFALKNDYSAMRLDAFSENESALRFYERSGYGFRGEVRFAHKPKRHEKYYCYEKILKRRD